jgi:hypothetical protein
LSRKSFVTALSALLICFAGVPLAARTSSTPVSVPAAHGRALLNVDRLAAVNAGVSADVLNLALGAVTCGVASGDLAAPPTLTLIDYSRPSTLPRLWVFDLRSGALLFTELVAHGRNSGDNMATRFSDAMESRESSLGLFRAADTYVGHNGYSLRLDGLEPGFNSHARERAIVIHGAPYVDPGVAKANGRLGRSFGCPALREAVARQVIDTVRGGGVIFSYYPDPAWLHSSKFLNCGATAPPTVATK